MGVILPGLHTSAAALFDRAARLKDVPFMIEKIWKEVGHKTKVVATGGLSPLLAPHLTHLHTIDSHLTLKGLQLLYQLNG